MSRGAARARAKCTRGCTWTYSSTIVDDAVKASRMFASGGCSLLVADISPPSLAPFFEVMTKENTETKKAKESARCRRLESFSFLLFKTCCV